ncbi:protein kinase [Catellatospora sp. NPDC049609]|uniref:serine/threonine protein kinase n=1 Tax=Catellatospora sp. NPDC049609 TaxID=3155505 RepID=UPI003432AF04
MKKGDDIKGYRIVSDPTTSGGGRCVWAFAEKAGAKYFIKQFLDPKWPTASSMGSPAGKQARRNECLNFEQRHRQVNERINPTRTKGGNLVSAVDFFREETTYYKVTERVEALSMRHLGGLPVRQVAVVIRTLCQSVRQLHRAGIVHGDLKPDNMLLQRSKDTGHYLAKVIDFDDSYPTGNPPPPDQIVGDQRYGAPEWLGYVKQDTEVDAADLTVAADVFTLALVFHVYLAGALPGYDAARFGAAADAVRMGEPLVFDPRLDPGLIDLMRRMTALRPADRPSIDDVLARLADGSLLQPVGAAGAGGRPGPGRDAPVPPQTRPPVGRLRINMGD